MTIIPTQITFFERLIPSIIAGKKTITIRDKSESNYVPGTTVSLYAFETNTYYTDIKILSVDELLFDDISSFHAQQEAMPLPELKALIKQIYPNDSHLYCIEFELVNAKNEVQ